MRIQIRGANRFVVTDAIKNYIEEKVGSLQRFLPTNQDLEARVYIKIYDVIQKVEVTIPGNQFILRAEEESDNLYAAIDLVVDKLERQIRRHKTKANKKIREREGISNYFINMDDTPEVYNKHDEIPYKIKNVHLKPMDVEEAIMQLELLGHDFYVYRDMEVDTVCVVYRRKDGKYAVIETNH
ncbi:MAG TPA: ribosome-associated translation inhibitor RaiA [Candidatus Atopostipes pullistercoris]|uniref:Ribosome hibernation promoting factor n=1 Tax=Candidatus Atopostipes pullistercoris TaxID=2838467 RepID=A0A9D2G2A1_9LACT|nr:ribosome-associated translation inhibitor RaiA [Turicibacter sp. TJ11]HIZ71132.1 ribosome-associated translation inhibitor RaiA [Candidatus Atopostipes pullistercoris]